MSRLVVLVILIFSSIGSYGNDHNLSKALNDILARFTVHAGAHDRINTPIVANLSGIFLKTETYELQLVETTNGANREVASQLESNHQSLLWWILEGKTSAGTERQFELRHKPLTEVESQKDVSIEDTGDAVNVQIGGKNVLAYHYGVTPAPNGADKLYSRGGYIHPLWSPAGEVLTRIQPSDHYHHYGIWNPWTKTEFQGKEIDFWNLIKGQGTIEVKSVSSKVEGDIFAGISSLHEHIDLKAPNQAGSQVALNEQWDIRVWNTDPENKVWLVDFTSTMSCATTSPLTIKEYRYEGFGFRANKAWDDESATLLTSEGFNKSNGNGTRARWCDVKGPSKAGTSGILFMTHPSNYNFPEKIRIWPVGMNKGKENVFFNFNPTQDRDWVLKPGKNYNLKYRMMVYDGDLDPETANTYWNDLANPPKVVVQTYSSDDKQKKVLVYTKNGEGYVHENIPSSIAAIKKLGKENGFAVDASEDPGVFTDENLKQYDALIFSNTNNGIFDTDAQKEAFQRYIRGGGAFVGIHSACGSERSWPWFWKVLGGKFHRHAPRQDFDVKIVDKNHPSTESLPDTWHIKNDECYYLKQLNPGIHVLVASDLTTVKDDKKAEYPGEIFGDTFPTTWCNEFDGGRQWYTSLGHQPEHYEDPLLMKHILGGIFWVMKIK